MKGDLDGTILLHAIFCSARCLHQAKIVYNLHHIVALYVDIFRVVCICRKDVVV